MTYKGYVSNINENTNEVTFMFNDFSVVKTLQKYEELPMGVSVHKWKEERSLAQNALMWELIGKIAKVTRGHKWNIYLEMLKRYGKFTHILVKPEAVERFKKEWREVEELGEITTENGDKAVQLRVFYGSHLYTTEEMTALINGIMDECHLLNIKIGLSKEEKERYGLK